MTADRVNDLESAADVIDGERLPVSAAQFSLEALGGVVVRRWRVRAGWCGDGEAQGSAGRTSTSTTAASA